MCAVITAESGDAEKVAQAIVECERIDIKVLPPNVNFSGHSFQVEGDNVRFGLVGIKNVGDGPIAAIVNARNEGGKFTSLDDLVSRTRGTSLTKRALESLIKAGAMDEFGPRQGLLTILDAVVEKFSRNNAHENQGGLFDVLEEPQSMIEATPMPDVEEATLMERAAWEKELMGLYITANPLKKVGEDLDGKVTHTLQAITEDVVGFRVTVGGMVTAIRKIFTKAKNSEMAFVTINDGTAEQEIIVFPKTLEECRQHLVDETVLVVQGRVDNKDDRGIKVLAETVTPADQVTMDLYTTQRYQAPVTPAKVIKTEDGQITITVPRDGQAESLQQLKKLIQANPGQSPITLVLPNGPSGPRTLKLPMKVDSSDSFMQQITQLFGLKSEPTYH